MQNSHHNLPCVNWQIGIIKAPVELDLSNRLVCWVMVRRKVLVRQRLGSCYPLLGVEDQHALEKVDRWRVGVPELVLERLSFPLGEGLNESEGLFVNDISILAKLRKIPSENSRSRSQWY